MKLWTVPLFLIVSLAACQHTNTRSINDLATGDTELTFPYVYCLHNPRAFLSYPLFYVGDDQTECGEPDYVRVSAVSFHDALRWRRLTIGYPGYEIQFVAPKLLTAFNTYTLMQEPKAFAVIALPPEDIRHPWIIVGSYGVSETETSLSASIRVVEKCEKAARDVGLARFCALYSIDDEVVWKNRNLELTQ
ncbi:MAG: hypothetical protein JJ900_10705 [Rhodospirillales bacterium]|nr:hypothetical protein [Rhodospirillales bacterium]MBO6787309.1 hypothetical protein [Rhodospirillales bacterium]